MTPDEAARQKQEQDRLAESNAQAEQALDELLGKADKARKELQALREDKDSFLLQREQEAQECAGKATERARKAAGLVEDMGKQSSSLLERAGQTITKTITWLSGLLEQADRLIESSENLKKRWELNLKELERQNSILESLTQKTSEKEHALNARAKVVEERSKDADRKLQEAESLAYWHDKPGIIHKK